MLLSFRDMTTYSLVDIYGLRKFYVALYVALMETVRSSETSVQIYQTMRRHTRDYVIFAVTPWGPQIYSLWHGRILDLLSEKDACQDNLQILQE
jgi:hypothetical protein